MEEPIQAFKENTFPLLPLVQQHQPWGTGGSGRHCCFCIRKAGSWSKAQNLLDPSLLSPSHIGGTSKKEYSFNMLKFIWKMPSLGREHTFASPASQGLCHSPHLVSVGVFTSQRLLVLRETHSTVQSSQSKEPLSLQIGLKNQTWLGSLQTQKHSRVGNFRSLWVTC